jgi:hypothetical protein
LDYKGTAQALQIAGYATDPQYAAKLIRLIETYNLTQYDKAANKIMDELWKRMTDLEGKVNKILEEVRVLQQTPMPD